MSIAAHFDSILSEMPIGNLQKLGDWEKGAKQRGYDKPSIGILSNDNGVEKIRKLWGKVDQTFDLYFLRSSDGWKHTEVGEVSEDWVRENLKIDIPIDYDHTTVIFTNNKGSEKVPMTAWTLAHRFGHACRRYGGNKDMQNTWTYFNNEYEVLVKQISSEIYGHQLGKSGPSGWGDQGSHDSYMRNRKIRLEISQGLGTMKSARDRNLRNHEEFLYELVAQYMITGRVKLNRNLPDILQVRQNWGRPDGPYKRRDADVSGYIEDFENKAASIADEIVQRSVGRIYVM
jgi:hypothetical protein